MINVLDPKCKWFLDRHSKFTASSNSKLLLKGKDGTGFSVGGITYIEEKAIETMTELFENPKLEFVEPLIFGNAQEQHAYESYVEVSKNYNMRYFGSETPVFLDYNEYSGGSPDGLMGQGDVVHWGLEIKSPMNSKNHYKYLKFKTQWDLKEQRIEYYTQIQFLLMITKADGFHFSSYDERFKDKKLRVKILDVLPDKSFQDNLEIRLHLAQKEKLKIIKEIR